MIGRRSTISPEVRALLDRERDIPSQPAAVRVRAMARARAAVAAGLPLPEVPPVPVSRPRWAVAAVAACVVCAALGAVAYAIHARRPAAPPPAERPIALGSSPAVPWPSAAPAALAAPVAAMPAHTTDTPAALAHEIGAPRLSRADALRAELHLLRQARAAVGREDFASALVPIAEHARRFRDGRLAEEREALRVKALAGLGRTEEARRAAAAFRAHFPHSVLLPVVSQMPALAP